LSNGSIIVGDGATDPVALAAFTNSTGDLKHEAGGLEADVNAYDGLVGITGGATFNQTGTTTQIIIFDGAGAPTSAALSSDVTMDNAGAVTISANAVALTTDTTGNYAAGDGEAGAATTGDSATAFFGAGTIEHERGGIEADISAIADGGVLVGTGAGTMAIRASFLTAGAAGTIKHELGGVEADVSGYSGLIGINSGSTSEVDTESELETHLGGLDVVTVTSDDISSANLATLVSDETGSGVVVFGTTPTIATPNITGNITAEPKHLRFNLFDPNALYDVDPHVCVWPALDANMTITELSITLNTANLDIQGDLKYADAFIGVANDTVITDANTISGVKSTVHTVAVP
ncbi:hypothetical protein LCGC14_3088880, partial [marine sediment metagenome]